MIHLRIIRFIFVSLLFSFFLQITSAENSYSVEMNTFLEQDKDDVTDFESKDTQQVDVDNTEGVNGSANEKTVVKTKEPVVEVTTQKSILTLIQETDLLTKGIAS